MIEDEVFKCLERHGFKRKSESSASWQVYESAKQWVMAEVAINGSREYDEAIRAISKYINV